MAHSDKTNRRKVLIEKIMKEKYGDDEPEYFDDNLDYLQSLSLNELEALANQYLDGEL